MPGRFVVTKSPKGNFHFVLKAGNGEAIATSETYKTHESALKGVASVRKNAPDAILEGQVSEIIKAAANRVRGKA